MRSLDVAEILSRRSGEGLALHERYLNPQLVRVLRTIGFDRTWVAGTGAYLRDSEGDDYLDLLGGFGVFAVGRNHPEVGRQLEAALAAGTAALPQMGVTLLAGVLAEELLLRAPAGLGAVHFTSSGSESVEAAMKLARAATGRPRLVSCDHGFHGLTLGSLSLNGNAEFRDRFGPLLPGCVRVPFGDLDALRRELRAGDVAAFVVEPIQGKGVHLPTPDYLGEAQELCRRYGTLLVIDEVQTGLGRTGRFLALEHWGLEPDIVIVSKALSGGHVPIGAVLATRRVFDRTFDSMERAVVHSSTFGGGDLAAAAGIATLAVLDDERLVARSEARGRLLLELTRSLVDRYEIVSDVRGLGLMWAIELGPPRGPASRGVWRIVEAGQSGLAAQVVVGRLFAEHHMLTQVAGHRMNVIKILPPLVISEDDVRRFAAALEAVLAEVERFPRAMARFGIDVARRALRRTPGAAAAR